MSKRLCLFICLFGLLVQLYGQPTVPEEVTKVMTTREMRHHHFLWHNVRNLWDRFDNETQQKIRDLGWEPPRPSSRYVNKTTYTLENNDSGEDFLYMHRKMIETANNASDSFKVVGWKYIPPPTSTINPLPPAYITGSASLDKTIALHKSYEFYRDSIYPAAQKFRDPEYLKTISLGKLGARLEFTIHSWLHTRFSKASTLGYRSRNNLNPLPNISAKWDDPAYDWLVDNYAAQVDPYFWKLHGWVDDRIQDWMNANNVTELVWKGTWVGGPMTKIVELAEIGKNVTVRTLAEASEHHHGHGDMETNESQGTKTIDVMEELTKILLDTGMEYSMYDGEEVVLGGDDLFLPYEAEVEAEPEKQRLRRV